MIWIARIKPRSGARIQPTAQAVGDPRDVDQAQKGRKISLVLKQVVERSLTLGGAALQRCGKPFFNAGFSPRGPGQDSSTLSPRCPNHETFTICRAALRSDFFPNCLLLG